MRKGRKPRSRKNLINGSMSLGNCGKRGNNRYVSGKVEPGT